MKLNSIEKQGDRVSPEKYVLMDEQEKDREIEKAVARLQKRVQEILFPFENKKPGH